MTPITDKRKFKILSDLQSGTREVVDVETARELEEIAEALANMLSDANSRLECASRWLTNNSDVRFITARDKARADALGRYQAMKEKAK